MCVCVCVCVCVCACVLDDSKSELSHILEHSKSMQLYCLCVCVLVCTWLHIMYTCTRIYMYVCGHVYIDPE